jgi:hypothetical protein
MKECPATRLPRQYPIRRELAGRARRFAACADGMTSFDGTEPRAVLLIERCGTVK